MCSDSFVFANHNKYLIMMKKLLLLVTLIVTTTFYGQETIAITGVSHPTVIATVASGGTFDVPFNYTSTGPVTLTVSLELISHGASGWASYTVPGSEHAIALSTNASATAATATLTFPSTNPITGADGGTESTWTLPGGTTSESALVVTPTGPNAGYRVKMSVEATHTLTGLNTAWPFNTTYQRFSDLDFSEITGVPYPPDSWTWNPISPADIMQASSVDIPITYTSDMDIAVDGIRFELVSVSGTPWSQAHFTMYGNSTILAAGTNVSANITMSSFPAAITLGTGEIMTKAQQIAANPNGASPTPTNYYFELRPRTSLDGNYSPTTPGTSFVNFLEDETISVDQVFLDGVNVYPNPTTGIVTISGLTEVINISVYNLNGRVVQTFSTMDSIDISDLAKGIYVLKADNGLIRKIIKE